MDERDVCERESARRTERISMAKQFDIEREIPLAAGASIAGRYDVIVRGWTFPEDVETWRRSPSRALEIVADERDLDAGTYRVIEWDDDYTLPSDRVHVFTLTTSIAYEIEPVQRVRNDELVSAPDTVDE